MYKGNPAQSGGIRMWVTKNRYMGSSGYLPDTVDLLQKNFKKLIWKGSQEARLNGAQSGGIRMWVKRTGTWVGRESQNQKK